VWQRLKNYYHLLHAVAANVRHGFPGEKLIVIGVTGTDGKTTTVNLIYHILKTAGKSVSAVSTVGAKIHAKESALGFHVTTPSSWQLQKFLKTAAETASYPNYLVLEVTSHAIDQQRIWGIPFTIGVLTNITHEHLDYHKNYKTYLKIKLKLLKRSKLAIINRDDASYDFICEQFKENSKIETLTYGLTEYADIQPKDVPVNIHCLGDINKHNVLAAFSVCKTLHLKDSFIKDGLETFQLPMGRQDIVFNKDFIVMIDFAHTPYAFEQLLSSIRKKTEGRIIHVFGSAGLRDRSKRPKMGRVSSQYADVIILTSEDPRTEDVNFIIKEIQDGIEERGKRIEVFKIPDRQEAIIKAIAIARKGDLLVITGKAHEKSMNCGNGEEPWDEYHAVELALKDL